MAADTTLNSGTGGDTIRAIDKAGVKVQAVVLDIGGAGAESLLTGTLPVSAASLPLPSGAATEAGHLATIDTSTAKIPPQGQALAAASMPVVLPAAQITTLTPPAAITGFALETGGNLAAIAGKDFATQTTLALVATAAKQDTGNTSLSSIDGKTPALGQALAAASTPVVLTAAQVTTLTPPAAIVGFAIEAGHLAAIDTATAKIPSQGQALAAASMPVVLTALQLASLTPGAITSIIPGTGATNLGKAEDAMSAYGDTGIATLSVRQDVLASDTSASGDYAFIKTDAQGRVWVNSDVLGEMLRQQSDLLRASLREATEFRRLTAAMNGMFLPLPEIF